MTARVDVAVDREVDRSVGVGRCRTQIQIVGAERAEPITLQHEGGFAQARGRSERGETAIEVLVDEENEYQIGIEIEHGPRPGPFLLKRCTKTASTSRTSGAS